MIPAIVPLATQIVADFGVGYLVHGGATHVLRASSLNLAKKACVGVAELAITGMVCDGVNNYIDSAFDKAAQFIVDNDLDKKFMKGDKKHG
jgi:hypothetical protein